MTKKGKRQSSDQTDRPVDGSDSSYDFDAEERSSVQRMREEKRNKFVKPAQSSGSNFNLIYVAVPAALIIIVGAILFFQNQSAANATAGGSAVATTGASADLPAGATREVPIQMSVADGKITISADDVRKYKLVTFDYKNGNKTVPLTAWITPSGAIRTAVRMCEPCNSTSFHIEGNVLVCNTCGTRWSLDTLKGISGGCQSYPPASLTSAENGGTISIDESAVKSWKPRA